MARPALDHAGRQQFREHDSGAEVDCYRAVDLFLLKRLQASRGRNSGVGDKHIDRAGFSSKSLRLTVSREVRDDDFRTAQLIREFVQRRLVASRQDELRAGLLQTASDVRAEAR